jgi:hypothetical protein
VDIGQGIFLFWWNLVLQAIGPKAAIRARFILSVEIQEGSAGRQA